MDTRHEYVNTYKDLYEYPSALMLYAEVCVLKNAHTVDLTNGDRVYRYTRVQFIICNIQLGTVCIIIYYSLYIISYRTIYLFNPIGCGRIGTV